MNTKTKQRKLRVKRPKPNLHGPNSPTPKKKFIESTIEENDQEKLPLEKQSNKM